MKRPKYKSIYKILLVIAKTSNWKVIEKKIKDSQTEGLIYVHSRVINIDKILSLKRKCVTLSHELIGHGYQWDCGYKKYKRFFNNEFFKETKKNLKYIEKIEIEASKLAADFLVILGWKDAHKSFEELDKKQLKEWLRDSWAETYLK